MLARAKSLGERPVGLFTLFAKNHGTRGSYLLGSVLMVDTSAWRSIRSVIEASVARSWFEGVFSGLLRSLSLINLKQYNWFFICVDVNIAVRMVERLNSSEIALDRLVERCAFIFDNDGTLTNSPDVMFAATNSIYGTKHSRFDAYWYGIMVDWIVEAEGVEESEAFRKASEIWDNPAILSIAMPVHGAQWVVSTLSDKDALIYTQTARVPDVAEETRTYTQQFFPQIDQCNIKIRETDSTLSGVQFKAFNINKIQLVTGRIPVVFDDNWDEIGYYLNYTNALIVPVLHLWNEDLIAQNPSKRIIVPKDIDFKDWKNHNNLEVMFNGLLQNVDLVVAQS